MLLTLFALGMTVGTGVKSALNASVFAASAGAFVLATAHSYRWSLDALLTSLAQRRGTLGASPTCAKRGLHRSPESMMDEPSEQATRDSVRTIGH